jgi:DNA-binding NarL/FixJ family response regulator
MIRMMKPEYDLKSEFTTRDIEILSLIADGLSNSEIARRLALTAKTIMFHKTRIYAKIGAARAIGAVRLSSIPRSATERGSVSRP